jgi:PPOX class probable F420-dependent enzyme
MIVMVNLDDSARNMLAGKNFAFVATLFRDGSPQVTPTWVDTDGEHVLINTAMGRVKQKNAKRDPRVAVAVAEQTDPYKMIMIRGRVVEQVTGQVAEDHIDKMAKKYMGLDRYASRQPAEKRVILKIKPERIARWG